MRLRRSQRPTFRRQKIDLQRQAESGIHSAAVIRSRELRTYPKMCMANADFRIGSHSDDSNLPHDLPFHMPRLCFCAIFVVSVLTSGLQADEVAPKSASTAATDSVQVGDRVIVTVAGAPLKTPEKTVWKAYPGDVYEVALVNGEWLWIVEKGGWLWQKQTLPFDTAIEQLTQQLDENETAETYNLRGVARLAHEDFENAVADFTASLQQGKRSAGVLNNRGKAYFQQADYQKAIADFDAALQLNPNHFVALNNRALCHIALGEFQTALQDLDAAVKLNDAYPEALNNRGVVHMQLSETQKAIDDYSAAIKIYGGYVEAYGNRSYAYRRNGQFDLAIADLRSAMKSAPLDFKPVNDLAWMLATSEEATDQQIQESVELATKACQMTQYENWNCIDTLAAACAAAGQFEQAEQWANTALKQAPAAGRPGLEEHVRLIQAQQPIRQ